MHNIIVTMKSNVAKTEDGEMIENNDGSLSLIDPDDIGILVQTHTIQTMKLEKVESAEAADTTSLEAGFTTRCEVYWDKRRSPAPAMVKPADLVWLELPADNDADDDDADDDEGEEIITDDDGGEGEEVEAEYEEVE